MICGYFSNEKVIMEKNKKTETCYCSSGEEEEWISDDNGGYIITKKGRESTTCHYCILESNKHDDEIFCESMAAEDEDEMNICLNGKCLIDDDD
jgi:hypothetical protein